MKALLTISLILSFATVYPMERDQQTVIVTLDGFLFEPGSFKSLWSMGWGGILASAAKGISSAARGHSALETQRQLQQDFFDLLKQLEPPQERARTQQVRWHGIEGPEQLYAHLSGQRDWQTIVSETKTGIETSQAHDKKMMKNFVDITFNPKKNSSVMQPIVAGAALVAALHKRGHRLMILDNWHAESCNELQKKHRHAFFAFTGDDIMLSSREKLLKSPELYQRFMTRYELNPESCIFIETQEHHQQALQEYAEVAHLDQTPRTVMLHEGNFKTVRQQLVEYGLLTEE